jgi:hypothetical protein
MSWNTCGVQEKRRVSWASVRSSRAIASLRPGVPLEQQRDDDLIWIRRPFLNRPHGLPYTVVHGHSITSDHRIDAMTDASGAATRANPRRWISAA